jgi:hypothetical protein
MGINVTAYNKQTGEWGKESVGMSYSNGARTLRHLGFTTEAEKLLKDYGTSLDGQALLTSLQAVKPLPIPEGVSIMPHARTDAEYCSRLQPFLMRVAEEAVAKGMRIHLS